MIRSNETAGSSGGVGNIQQVLTAGNTANGTLPLLFNNGAGDISTLNFDKLRFEKTGTQQIFEIIRDTVNASWHIRYQKGRDMTFTFNGNANIPTPSTIDFPLGVTNEKVMYRTDIVAQSVNVAATGAPIVLIPIPHGLSYTPRIAIFVPDTVAVATMIGFHGTTWGPVTVDINTAGVLFNVNLTGRLFTVRPLV